MSGPSGVTMISVLAACAHNEAGRQASASTQASAGKATHQTIAEVQSTVAPRFQRQASTTSTMTASASNSHRVGGMRPTCIAAIDNAPNATSSPCGIKMTRVTEKTSTRATAISPYTAPLTRPSCIKSRAI